MTRVFSVSFAVFIEEVGKPDFDYDIMVLDVSLKFFFILDDSVLECYTIRADEVGIDDEVVFGFDIPHCHILIPDFFGVGWLCGDACDDGGNN